MDLIWVIFKSSKRQWRKEEEKSVNPTKKETLKTMKFTSKSKTKFVKSKNPTAMKSKSSNASMNFTLNTSKTNVASRWWNEATIKRTHTTKNKTLILKVKNQERSTKPNPNVNKDKLINKFSAFKNSVHLLSKSL